MTRARSVTGYIGSTVLLLLGALLAWEVYVTLNTSLPLNTTVIAYGIPITLWAFDLIVAMLALGCFAGAALIMFRRPRRSAAVAH